jgi:hypothetical protein
MLLDFWHKFAIFAKPPITALVMDLQGPENVWLVEKR